MNRNSDVPEGEKRDFENFIGSMLRLEPRERPGARDLLKVKWLEGV